MITQNESVSILLKITSAERARLGEGATIDMIHNKHKIGSAFAKGSITPLKGLTFEEEKKFLPPIVGVSSSSDKFQSAVDGFWKNISREVHPETGLNLEIGMIYPDEESARKGFNEKENEAKKIIAARVKGIRYDENFDVRTKLGVPINISDYIIYRYSLKYSRVANCEEDLHRSDKIKFYIHSKELESVVKTQSLNKRRKAYTIYLEMTANDISSLSNVAILLKKEIQTYNKTVPDSKKLQINDEINTELALEAIASKYPARFIAIATDKELKMKAFIERAIDANELRRIPATDAIVYGDNTQIGSDLNEAVAFLNADKNKEILMALKARLKAFKK